MLERFKNEIKSLLVLIGFVFLLRGYGNGRVLAYTEQFSTITSGSSVNCGLEFLGTGLSGSIDKITFRFINDSNGDVDFNAGQIKLTQYDDNNYTCTYPCTGMARSPDSFSCQPSGRCTGGHITAGSQEVVQVEAIYSNTSFQSNKYYTVGYYGANLGERLKMLGIDWDNWIGGEFRYSYGDGGNYCRIDQPKTYSTTGLLTDMYFAVNDDVGYPYIIPSGSEIDIFNHKVYVDLNGDFLTAGSNYLGVVTATATCTGDGLPLIKHDYADATVRIYAKDCATSTQDLGGGYYFGQDYCYSPLHTGWSATHVGLPFPDGYQCTYNYDYCLYDDETSYHAVICGDAGTYTVGDTTTPIPAPTCDTLDVGCWIRWLGWKIGDIFTTLFSFNGIDASKFSALQSNLNTRIPFAYASAVYLSNWSAPITSGTSMPSMTFNFIGANSVQYIPDATVSTVFGSLRPFLVIGLWVGLVAYVIIRVRGLAQTL